MTAHSGFTAASQQATQSTTNDWFSKNKVLHRLARLLADAKPHEYETLAEALEVDVEHVEPLVIALREVGFDVAWPEFGVCQLQTSLVLLDEQRIREHLERDANRLAAIEVHLAIDSTNDHLARLARDGVAVPMACTAELQLKGRGRRGRTWISPPASNLYFSMLWRTAPPEPGTGTTHSQLGGLSLALGIAVAESLHAMGAAGVGLKWPNDLYWKNHKLGGLLVDVLGDPRKSCDVIAGIGVNVAMPQKVAETIDQPWCNLTEILGETPDRNEFAATIARAWLDAFQLFAQNGLPAFSKRWQRFDLCDGRPVVLQTEHASTEGIGRGINADGALLVEQDGVLGAHLAGEVSLRLKSS